MYKKTDLRVYYDSNIHKGHDCEMMGPYSGYGRAIEGCTEDGLGFFDVINGEYGSLVNYCPFCGLKATSSIDEALLVIDKFGNEIKKSDMDEVKKFLQDIRENKEQ